MQARLELENLAKRADESKMSDSDIQRTPEELHAKRGDISEAFLQESEEAAAAAAAAAAVPTEHSEETTNLPAEKELMHSIVNALLSTIRRRKNC